MKRKIDETMWAIIGIHGLYVGTAYTRGDMIRQHERDLGKDWKRCRNHGDRCIKVRVRSITAREKGVK